MRFSVVVPTYERPNALDRMLAALEAQSIGAGLFEVIVVDDGGRADLWPLTAGYAERLRVKLIRRSNGGPAAARNLGAAEASGEYLAFVDDDCRPGPEWLASLDAALAERPGRLCGGLIENGLPGNAWAEATAALSRYLYEHYSPENNVGGFYATNNLTVPREEFLAMRGFDESLRFGEDREFCYRWAVRGGRFAGVPTAVVFHDHEMGPLSFLNLHYCYGGGSAEFHRRANASGTPRVRLHSAGWYSRLILTGFRRNGLRAGAWQSVLLAATQVAAGAGFVARRFGSGWGEAPVSGFPESEARAIPTGESRSREEVEKVR